MPTINVNDAYILDETGAEVDKVTGLFTKDESTTSGEKAFAQLNIGGGGGGWNLLDNPFFTVRQRGDGPFSSGYTADRWGIFGGVVTVTLSGSGFSVSASVGYNIQQRLPADLASSLNGKVVTLSCIVDGVLYSATGTLDTSGGYQLINTFGNDRFAFVGGANPAVIFTHTTASATHSYTVSAVKLELGSVSTLANDVPPDYGTELRKCQYYFRRISSATTSAFPIGFGFAINGSTARILLPIGEMRANPSVSYVGSYIYLYGNGAYATVTGLSFAAKTSDGVAIAASSSGLTTYSTYALAFADTGLYIDLSADLQ